MLLKFIFLNIISMKLAYFKRFITIYNSGSYNAIVVLVYKVCYVVLTMS
jgi:hypothetical protein